MGVWLFLKGKSGKSNDRRTIFPGSRKKLEFTTTHKMRPFICWVENVWAFFIESLNAFETIYKTVLAFLLSPDGNGKRITWYKNLESHNTVFGFLKQTVEFNHLPCRARCFASVFLKQTVQFNRFFQKDRGITASSARILSPNPTRRLLPCLLL